MYVMVGNVLVVLYTATGLSSSFTKHDILALNMAA